MPLRESINDREFLAVAETLKETGDWEKTKKLFPAFDPKMLDKGFKVAAFKKAGLPLPEVKAEPPAPVKVKDPLK